MHLQTLDPDRRFYAGLLEVLVQVMGTAHGYLFEHGPRVALLAQAIGDVLGIRGRAQAELLFGGVLSDIGMIGLVDEAWVAPLETLSRDARTLIRVHPQRSQALVKRIPHLGSVAPLVRHHHEWWNGAGYPDGLTERGIPVGAQILRLADTVTALEEHRSHRRAMETEDVTRIIQDGSGKEFSPEVVDAYLKLVVDREVPEFHFALFHRACLTAAGALLPQEISPVGTQDFLNIIASLIDAKDEYTAGHSRRVAQLAMAMAAALEMGEGEQTAAWAGGYLHDLGKIGIPTSVLTKEGTLTAEERERIEGHAPAGARILASVHGLEHLAGGCRYHHERWDGSGYPEGLVGNRIPALAQMLGVCDAYDAMTSGRAYCHTHTHREAIGLIAGSRAKTFGPRIVDAFLTLEDRVFAELWAPQEAIAASASTD